MASVGAAEKTLADRLRDRPITVSTKNGNEYNEIGHKVIVSDIDLHPLVVLDRVVQDSKSALLVS